MIQVVVLLLLTESLATTDSHFSPAGPSIHRLIPSAVDLISDGHFAGHQRKDSEESNNQDHSVTADNKEHNTARSKNFIASPFLGEITSEPYHFKNFSKPNYQTAQSIHSHHYVLPGLQPDTGHNPHENDLKNEPEPIPDSVPKTLKYSVVEDSNEPEHEVYTEKIHYREPQRVAFPHTHYVYDLNHPLRHSLNHVPEDREPDLPKPTAPEMYRIPEGMPYHFEQYKPLKFEQDVGGTQTDVKEQGYQHQHASQPQFDFVDDTHFLKGHPMKGHKVEWKEHGHSSVVSPVKSLLKFVAALIPLGLFVAALQPNIIEVNSTQPDGLPKQRSVDKGTIQLPGLDMLEKFGFSSLDDPECEKRLFCQFAVLGSTPKGNSSQRGFWQLATRIPLEVVSIFGLADLFKAVRSGSCHIYKCQNNSTVLTSEKSKI